VQTSAIRVEVIRFSLLVTLTVALLSVAIRLASHNDAHSSLRPNGSPSGSSAPTTSSSPGFTASPAPVPSSTASFAPRGSGSGSGGSGTGSAGGAAGQPVLPVTGDDALKLIAMSLVFIGGGALTVRASRR